MAGSPIPDDWDEVSYRCYRVFFPDSEQYRAILLGQITEPENAHYWDENTGDVDLAVSSIFASTGQTLAEIFTEGCSQLIERPRPYFLAACSTTQTLPTVGYNTINFDTLTYNANSPGFNTSFHWHEISGTENEGLWLYNIGVATVPGGATTVRVFLNGANYRTAPNGTPFSRIVVISRMVDTDTLWVGGQNGGGKDLDIAKSITYFEGTWLGPLT